MGCIAPVLALCGVLGALLIGAIVLPGMSRSAISANESKAMGTVRAIASAQRAFHEDGVVDIDTDGVGDYGTLQELAANKDSSGTPYLDAELATGTKAGYSFVVNVTYGVEHTNPAYTCVAKPLTPGDSGQRQFYVDQSGIIRYTADGSEVGATSTPIK